MACSRQRGRLVIALRLMPDVDGHLHGRDSLFLLRWLGGRQPWNPCDLGALPWSRSGRSSQWTLGAKNSRYVESTFQALGLHIRRSRMAWRRNVRRRFGRQPNRSGSGPRRGHLWSIGRHRVEAGSLALATNCRWRVWPRHRDHRPVVVAAIGCCLPSSAGSGEGDVLARSDDADC